MKLQILSDLYTETNRLFIAGSKFAQNDPRVMKYIPQLEKMGEKVPVMAKLAGKYIDLVKADSENSASALLGAGNFLYAVLATQGTVEVDGETVEPKLFITEIPKTQTPYSRLEPVISALTLSKSGRYEVVQNAFDEGLLNDFRLYGPLATALDDGYLELATFVCKNVILNIGSIMIPYLLETYNEQGKRGDAMRLELLGAFKYEDVEKLALSAVVNGSPMIAVEGVKILGINKNNEQYLLKLANDRKSAVREAAFIALIRMDSAEGKELMIKMLEGSKYKDAVEGAALCTDTAYVTKIVDLVSSHVDTPDKFEEVLPCLRNKNDDCVYDFYKKILGMNAYQKTVKDGAHAYNARYGSRVDSFIFDCLLENGTKKELEFFEELSYIDKKKEIPLLMMKYFQLATKFYSPEKIYDKFSGYYASSKNIGMMEMYFNSSAVMVDRYSDDAVKKFHKILDAKWTAHFVKKNDFVGIAAATYDRPSETKNLILKCVRKKIGKPKIDSGLEIAIGLILKKLDKEELKELSDALHREEKVNDRPNYAVARALSSIVTELDGRNEAN
ncbi:hypothetical protein LQZ18_07900 [Lachnospiraceae bacterium ZAX-1]